MDAARTKNTYLRERYYRLAARRGKQRAVVAIEHSLLTAIWHMLVNNLDYHELGPDHFTRREPAHVMRASPNKPTHSASQSASTPSIRPQRPPEPLTVHFRVSQRGEFKSLNGQPACRRASGRRCPCPAREPTTLGVEDISEQSPVGVAPV
jgi:hypothetical protein